MTEDVLAIEQLVMLPAMRAKISAMAPDLLRAIDFSLWATLLACPWEAFYLPDQELRGRVYGRMWVVLDQAAVSLAVCDDIENLMLLDVWLRPEIVMRPAADLS
jgi:hypothetical protein